MLKEFYKPQELLSLKFQQPFPADSAHGKGQWVLVLTQGVLSQRFPGTRLAQGRHLGSTHRWVCWQKSALSPQPTSVAPLCWGSRVGSSLLHHSWQNRCCLKTAPVLGTRGPTSRVYRHSGPGVSETSRKLVSRPAAHPDSLQTATTAFPHWRSSNPGWKPLDFCKKEIELNDP